MTEKAAPQIRMAGLDDTELMAELGRRTFDDAFRANVGDENMDAYLAEAFTLEKMRAELADGDSLFLLATVDSEPVGYSKLHFGAPHESVTSADWHPAVKLWRLYADARWYGRGIGAALMAASIRAARERGGGALWLTTNIYNQRAIDFYRRWGFTIVGETTFTLGSAVHKDYVFARTLTDADR